MFAGSSVIAHNKFLNEVKDKPGGRLLVALNRALFPVPKFDLINSRLFKFGVRSRSGDALEVKIESECFTDDAVNVEPITGLNSGDSHKQ
jgi:hypothetical protein